MPKLSNEVIQKRAQDEEAANHRLQDILGELQTKWPMFYGYLTRHFEFVVVSYVKPDERGNRYIIQVKRGLGEIRFNGYTLNKVQSNWFFIKQLLDEFLPN